MERLELEVWGFDSCFEYFDFGFEWLWTGAGSLLISKGDVVDRAAVTFHKL